MNKPTEAALRQATVKQHDLIEALRVRNNQLKDQIQEYELNPNTRKSEIPTIGEVDSFYGYITGLFLKTLDKENRHDQEINTKFFVSFEYWDCEELWIVPDADLFLKLIPYLHEMAFSRHDENHGQSKLRIGKKRGEWVVELP